MPRATKREPYVLILCALLLQVAHGCGSDPSRKAGGGDRRPPGDCAAAAGDPGVAEPLYVDVGAIPRGGGENCGEEGCPPRAPFVGDGPYDPDRGYGWLGPAAIEWRDGWLIGANTDDDLDPGGEGYLERTWTYRTWAQGLTGYRVDVPDGVYRVTLLLLEPVFPAPGLRVFDVVSDGVVLIPGLDLGATAGQDETVAVAVQVAALEGRIALDFTARTDEPPVLAGLVVEPAQPGVPPAPTGLEVRAGAAEVLLRWGLPETAPRGWLVERSVDDGPFEPATPTLLPTPVFVDRDRAPGEPVVHRVSAVDASCAIGEAARSTATAAGAPSEFGLPVVDVTVAPDALAAIHADPESDLEVAATVRSGEESAAGTIRLRGRSTLFMARRSFRIRLDSGTIDGRDRLKLLAEQPDPTRMWQLLGYDLFGRMGALASRARPVLLRINGRNYGVYDDVEHVGDDFLTSRGYGVDDRFRIEDVAFALTRTESGDVDLSGYEKKENRAEPSPELEALIVWLSTAAEHEVDAALDAYVDVPVLVDYLAGQILMANLDVIDGGHYLVLDPGTGRFLLVPWDLNNESWSWWDPSLSHFTFFDVGPEPEWWEVNWLWARAIANHAFRDELIRRIEELLATVFAAAMDRAIDDVHASLSPALAVEPWLWRRRVWPRIAAGPGRIHEFVAARRAYVEEALVRLEGLDRAGVVLSEVAPGPDGSGGWVELHNRGTTDFDLEHCWLSDDPMRPRGRSLSAEAALEPDARRVVDGGAGSISVGVDGGFVGLWCGDQHEEDEGRIESGCEEDCYGYRSTVFYPPLDVAAAYERTGIRWAVGEPSPGR